MADRDNRKIYHNIIFIKTHLLSAGYEKLPNANFANSARKFFVVAAYGNLYTK